MAMLVDGKCTRENRARGRAVKLISTSFITMICLLAALLGEVFNSILCVQKSKSLHQ